MFFDDATESALAARRAHPARAGARGRRVRRVPRGPGTSPRCHVAALECESRDTVVERREGGVADVRGELPPSDAWLEAAPAGSPDGWRLSRGRHRELDDVQRSTRTSSLHRPSGTSTPYGATLVGPAAAAGLQGRWLTLLLDARFEIARNTGNSADSAASTSTRRSRSGASGCVPASACPSSSRALSTGLGLHIGQYFFSPDSPAAPRQASTPARRSGAPSTCSRSASGAPSSAAP